ncbi:hypothetical protein E4U61_001327 [Claviceps capensis]|nr:hypothetical protein E4U61_001327 [Claviceps capensis]
MAIAHSNRRASSSSIASSSSSVLHRLTASSAVANTSSQRADRKRSQSQSQSQHYPPGGAARSCPSPPVHPSMLQPRVAVVLNVNPQWHPYLFAFRLLSILPALWWGLPSALQLVLSILYGHERVMFVREGVGGGTSDDGLHSSDDTVPFALTEGALATIWSFACGYLAFFFTDCLMSRWLIHYTPQATIVRLLTINAVNAYLTMTVLSLAGGFQDPRLMLPGWIGMATTLTVSYHITHQKINIRKETSTSINVFSIASYISMVILLAHVHLLQPDYPPVPLVGRLRIVWNEIYTLLAHIKRSIERTEL